MADAERRRHATIGAEFLEQIVSQRRSTWESKQREFFRGREKRLPADDEWRAICARYQPALPATPTGLNEIPADWTWASLDQLLDGIDAGKNFSCDERPPEAGETGIIKVSAVTWGTFDEDESKTITAPDRIDERYLVRPGDLLISRANTLELVGASVVVRNFKRRLLLSDKVLRLRLVVDLRDWVNRVLRSHIGRRQIEALATGAQLSMRNITQDNLRKLCIPLPPPSVMEWTASRIDELFSRIESGERAIAVAREGLKRYRKSILKAAVTGTLTADWREGRGKPRETGHQLLAHALRDRAQQGKRDLSPRGADDATYELPSCWAWATLDRLTVIKGGVTVDRKKLPDDPVTLPYLRVANVQDGRIDLSEIKEITVERKKAEDCLLRNGDILLNEGGDLDKLGRGWVWEEQVAPCIHQNHVFRARPVNADINPYFISHYANTMGRTFFMEKGKHSVNLASISLTEISKLPVPLPPADEQAEIVSRVEEALSRIDHAETTLNVQARNARALKQSILKAAFEGRLVPQDPNDKPASGTLARMPSATSAPRTKTKARA
jgi:type I restriction enzyme S subunit